MTEHRLEHDMFETSDEEITARCHTFRDALRLAWEKSGKSLKTVAAELEDMGHNIDVPTLSLWLSEKPAQKKNFDPAVVTDFISVTNLIPLRYLALTQGCGLVKLKSALEMENEQLKRELEEARLERETILKVMRELNHGK